MAKFWVRGLSRVSQHSKEVSMPRISKELAISQKGKDGSETDLALPERKRKLLGSFQRRRVMT